VVGSRRGQVLTVSVLNSGMMVATVWPGKNDVHARNRKTGGGENRRGRSLWISRFRQRYLVLGAVGLGVGGRGKSWRRA
jgi:hypothetical protein